MDKCSPVEMRKNLEVVNLFTKAGIDFVPIPAKNKEHKQELIEKMQKIMTEMESEQ